MSIVVTGATGHLGRLVVESLLARGVAAADIVATGRNVGAIADLAERGVTVRHADFDDPASLTDAFAGADKLLLVSASELGRRIPQHRNAVDAAREAGVTLLAYTSAPKADHTELKLAAEHRATEEYIRASGGAVRVPAQLLVLRGVHRADRHPARARRGHRRGRRRPVHPGGAPGLRRGRGRGADHRGPGPAGCTSWAATRGETAGSTTPTTPAAPALAGTPRWWPRTASCS